MTKYVEMLRVHMQSALVFQADTLISALLSLVQVLVSLILWRAVIADRPEIGGYTLPMLVSYYVAVAFLTRASQTERVTNELTDDIVSGKYVKYTVRPVNPLACFIAGTVGATLARFVVNLLGLAVALAVFSRYMAFRNLQNVALAVVLWAGGLLAVALFNYVIGLLAFWFTDVGGLFVLKDNLVLFLAGSLIPLDLLPGGVRHVVSWLPFGYLAFEPARLLVTGSLSTGLNPALLHPAWIAGLWLVASGLQRLAIRKFDAVGI